MKLRGALVAALVVVIGAVVLWRRSSADLEWSPIAASPAVGPSCPDRSETPRRVDRELRFITWRGRGVTEVQVRDQLERASAVYARHGVRLLTPPEPRALDAEALLEGSREVLEEGLRAAGIDPRQRVAGANRERSRQVICAIALGPLRRWLAEEASRDHVNVVILTRIAEPQAAIAALLPDLRGLTLHPPTTGATLTRCLGDDDVPSAVLIGLDGIAARRPETVDVTLAHELGHVLGLSHPAGVTPAPDLMATDPPACVPLLTNAQLDQLAM